MNGPDDGLFWELAEEHLATGAERSTMMGLPCLRIDGIFFVSMDRHTGDLIAKLPSDRVCSFEAAGTGQAFAPNGRRFKEWIQIPQRDRSLWDALITEAREFATHDS
jgi:hypothetical protein